MMDSGVALVLTTLMSIVPGVSGTLLTISALVASSAVAGVLFIVIIVVLVIGLTWKDWFPKWQRWRGKVKVPRRVRKMRQLRQTMANRPSQATYASSTIEDKDAASYIHRWNSDRENYEGIYEEKVKSIDLPEEEEIRIETYVVENETLNLGPFDTKPAKTDKTQIDEFEATTDELYATVDKNRKSGDEGTLSQGSSGIGSATTPNGESMDKQTVNRDHETQQQLLSFSEQDSTLVLF
ncbi:uncharacterized protein LOC121378305 [Gigantopelta aegis]|uniref:uncharacterized protein LOC121378305 n=1 Tax=Gigantopelta aegis TaxID=1735272 RepID=UPI001B8880B4|nr:uncharacterized protein LOC121378305 [Gigantopelta aegis]